MITLRTCDAWKAALKPEPAKRVPFHDFRIRIACGAGCRSSAEFRSGDSFAGAILEAHAAGWRGAEAADVHICPGCIGAGRYPGRIRPTVFDRPAPEGAP